MTCVGNVLGMCWGVFGACFRDVLGNVLGVFWGCVGCVFGYVLGNILGGVLEIAPKSKKVKNVYVFGGQLFLLWEIGVS